MRQSKNKIYEQVLHLVGHLLLLIIISIFSFLFNLNNSFANVQVSESRILNPPFSLINQWTNQYFDFQEFWIIKSRSDLRFYLNERNFSEGQIQLIMSKVQKKFNADQMGKMISNLSLSDSQGVIFVDREFKQSFNHEQLQQIYYYLWQNNKLIHFRSFTSQNELKLFLSKYSLSQAELSLLYKMLFNWEGQIFLIFTPEYWSKLNIQMRKDFVLSQLKESHNRSGVQVSISLNQAIDLSRLAEKYSMGRNPAPLERYLYQLRKLGIQSIPIEKILTPFVRRFADQYSSCHGPNCMNSAMNVGRKKNHIQLSTTDTDEFLSSMHDRYEMIMIDHDRELIPGDVLVYSDFNKGNDVDHAAVYVGDGLVFTKNGVSRNNPYIFQFKSKMEENFKYKGQQNLIVYRPMRITWHPSCRYVFQ